MSIPSRPGLCSLLLFLCVSVLLPSAARPEESPWPRQAVLRTSLGEFRVELYPDVAPRAVENFAGLARRGFYDSTLVHRAVEGFLIQGGDPTGEGYGGESLWGLPFANEVDSSLRFDTPGRLALANRGRPETNTSQFFVTVEPAPWLDGDYTIFGQVVEGLDVVRKISETEVVGAQDRPAEDIVIVGIEILNDPPEEQRPR